MLRLLEVNNRAAAPADAVGQKAHLRQQGRHLPAGLCMAGIQLQMIALFRVGDTAPRQKGPPQEGRPAALVLQQPEVHMEHQILPGIVAQLVDDAVQLAPVGDAEDQLPPLLLRQTVEFQTEGPLEQPGQPGGKVSALGNDPHLCGAEGIAVEQHTIGLSSGAAQALHRHPAQLVFYLSRK